jgi:O-acetyl-ADP-ribose deacetylase (regulator of RNase III)
MTRERRYEFGSSGLTLRFGDLTTSRAQVLVSSDDGYLTMGGGVSAALLKAGGSAVAHDAVKKVPAMLGDVVVTTAGTLPAQYIFHAVTIGRPRPGTAAPKEIIEGTTRRCLEILDALRLDSIAFPAIGAGAARFSYADVASCMSAVIAEDLARRTRPVEIALYLLDVRRQMREMDFLSFFEEFARRNPRVAGHAVLGETKSTTTVAPDPAPAAPATAEEIKRQRLYRLRTLISTLEDQRFRLEAELIERLGDTAREAESKRVQDSLRANEALRIKYLAEWKALAGEEPLGTIADAASPKAHPTVFVSSSSLDLRAHRDMVKEQIARRDMLFRGMEHFGADPAGLAPATRIVEEVRRADVYLGIFGVRYGSIDPVTSLSMTELEFREAEARQKPMLLYVIHDNAQVEVSQIEADPEGKRKLEALRAHLLRKYVPYKFRSVDDLGRQVFEDLGKPVNTSG